MDHLHSSFYFQTLQSLYQSFGDYSKSSNYNWYNRHSHVPQVFFGFFFNPLARSRYLSFSIYFNFTRRPFLDSKVHNSASSHFFVIFFKVLIVWPRVDYPFVSYNHRGVCASHFPGRTLGCMYSICSFDQLSVSRTIPSRSPYPHSRDYSYTLFVLICCIRL